MNLLTLLLVVLVIAVAFGAFGQPRYGYVSLGPIALVLLVIVLLWLAGVLR